MDALIPHPAWCRRADCASTGAHVSRTVQAGQPGDLLGVDAALMELVDAELRVLRLTITEDGAAATYCVPAHQARDLSEAIALLLPG